MKKLLSLLLALLSLPILAQNLSFKDCESPACSEEKLHALFSETQAALFEYYGFAYNDSLSISFKYDGEKLKPVASFAWLNEFAVNYYAAVLEANMENLNLEKDSTYHVYWNQKIDYAWLDYQPISTESKFPVATDCKEFNKKGQLACAKYFAQYELNNALDNYKIEEDIKLEVYFDKGQPSAIYVSRAPLKNKRFIKAFQLFMETYTKRFTGAALQKSGSYSYSLKRSHLEEDFDKANPHFEKQLGFYIDNKLWSQLKRAIDPYNDVPTIDTAGRTYEEEYQKAMYLYLEEQLAEGRIPARMWTFDRSTFAAIKSLENEDGSEITAFNTVQKVPVYPGCDEEMENEALTKCFQTNIMRHVGSTFQYPKEARKRGIHGRVYVNFIVEKDGSLSEIEILKGAHPLLDLESIRVVSLIPDFEAALMNGEPVRMSFTLPINAKLK